MNLHLIQTRKFKTTVVCLLLRQPLERETATITAVIPPVLARGCEKYPSLTRINSVLESMYGSIFDCQIVKKGEEQIIQLYMEFMGRDERLRLEALEFLHEVMMYPRLEGAGFDRSYVEGEKANLRLAIEGRINNKSEYAKLRTIEEMCRGERFGVYGDGYIEDIAGLTPEGIYARYSDILKRSAVDIIVMGDEDRGVFEHLLRQVFRREPGGDLVLPPPETSFTAREPRRVAQQCGITQGKICMGFRTGAANTGAQAYKLMLMNEVLGGGPSSKLFANVRERENLCYYVNSFVYRSKSIVFVQSGVDESNFDRLEELVHIQIKEIAKGNVSQAELSNAKKSLVKRIRGMQDSQAGYIDFYMSQRMLNDTDGCADIPKRLERLTADDISEIAGKMRLDTVFRLEAGGGNG